MEPRVWLSSVEFSDGSTIPLNKNDIVVFVGPNNAGKSASLKELFHQLQYRGGSGKVIKNTEIEFEGTQQDLFKFVNKKSEGLQNIDNSNYRGYRYNLAPHQLINQWNNLPDNGLGALWPIFADNLSTQERLNASNPPNNIPITTQPPQHPIHFLQRDDELEYKFSEYFKVAFGFDFIVHRGAGNTVPIHVGKRPVPAENEDRISKSYCLKIEKLDLLSEQGDGVRSFAGVLLNAFIATYSVLFIDEPEAFLHPPQAMLLGKMLVDDLPHERQLFIATHSEDFLKGLLKQESKRLKIIRIQRQGAINKIKVLLNEDIKQMWGDPLLRHSNILSGLFHSQVVLCEGDSDCKFYSSILSSLNEGKTSPLSDILFIHCGGKHRMPVVIKALKALDVNIKIVVDFDILNDKKPLNEIYISQGGNWVEIEKDWNIVKKAIDKLRPQLERVELMSEIQKIFSGIESEKIVPTSAVDAIKKNLKKATPWAQAKSVGVQFIPSGDATSAFKRLNKFLLSKKIFIVEVGELEGFYKNTGSHGPQWVNEVLSKDLKLDVDLRSARKFVAKIVK